MENNTIQIITGEKPGLIPHVVNENWQIIRIIIITIPHEESITGKMWETQWNNPTLRGWFQRHR